MVSKTVRTLIQTKARPEELLREGLREGAMLTLRQDGICKVLMGLTTAEEVRANCNV